MRQQFQNDSSGAKEERGSRDGTLLDGGDYLDYLSDMVLELKSMAEQADTPTLAGLLELAYREARLQREQRLND